VVLALVLALAGCAPTADDAETPAAFEPSVSSVASAVPSDQAEAFPTEPFAAISEDTVSEEAAAELQAILDAPCRSVTGSA